MCAGSWLGPLGAPEPRADIYNRYCTVLTYLLSCVLGITPGLRKSVRYSALAGSSPGWILHASPSPESLITVACCVRVPYDLRRNDHEK